MMMVKNTKQSSSELSPISSLGKESAEVLKMYADWESGDRLSACLLRWAVDDSFEYRAISWLVAQDKRPKIVENEGYSWYPHCEFGDRHFIPPGMVQSDLYNKKCSSFRDAIQWLGKNLK
jgi:hypothetical protein